MSLQQFLYQANTFNYTRPHYFAVSGGFIQNPNDERKFYLRFEVKKYDGKIPLSTTKSSNVGKYLKLQHIQNWKKVSFEELKHIKVCKLVDEKGDYFISDTSWYIPEWLRTEASSTNADNFIPPDKKLVYTVENNPHFDDSSLAN